MRCRIALAGWQAEDCELSHLSVWAGLEQGWLLEQQLAWAGMQLLRLRLLPEGAVMARRHP